MTNVLQTENNQKFQDSLPLNTTNEEPVLNTIEVDKTNVASNRINTSTNHDLFDPKIKKTIETIDNTINSNKLGRFKCFLRPTAKEINNSNIFFEDYFEKDPKYRSKIDSIHCNMKYDDNYQKIKKFTYVFPKINLK